MDGIGAAVNAGFADLSDQLLLVIPGGLAVAGLLWGAPKAVKFFKRVAS